jgi:hypothetical protein
MKEIGVEKLGSPAVLELKETGEPSLVGSPMRNTVRLADGQDIPRIVEADELFVSVDPSRDIVVQENDGVLRWAEITRSDVELLVTMGAHAQIDLGPHVRLLAGGSFDERTQI